MNETFDSVNFPPETDFSHILRFMWCRDETTRTAEKRKKFEIWTTNKKSVLSFWVAGELWDLRSLIRRQKQWKYEIWTRKQIEDFEDVAIKNLCSLDKVEHSQTAYNSGVRQFERLKTRKIIHQNQLYVMWTQSPYVFHFSTILAGFLLLLFVSRS